MATLGAPTPEPSARNDALPSAEEKHARVRAMFDRIAPRYDLLNRMISLGLDQRWRNIALDEIAGLRFNLTHEPVRSAP